MASMTSLTVAAKLESCTPKTGGDESSSSQKSVNPFFAGITYSRSTNELGELVKVPSLQETMKDNSGNLTPTTIQHTLCLNATSNIDVDITDDELDSPNTFLLSRFPHSFRRSRASSKVKKAKQSTVLDTKNLCNKSSETCACIHKSEKEVSKVGSEVEGGESRQTNNFPLKTTPITDEYKITHEIIGIGESGKVMACFSKANGEKYALKVLRDGPRSRREVHLHYLTNDHENIVTIIDIFENTFDSVKCLLVVVEFLEGGDLLTRFENQERTPYSEEHVAKIIRQIGSAVHKLHEMNIAHRDIKLENILCSTNNSDNCTYKLADFGFAKRPERNNLMESPCCTPAYVCPEILSHERYDKSCDMWAMGVVMYILLCGYPPFYSMKGLPFSPGMKDRITVGLYAFPAEDWDHIAPSTKNEIRHLLRTDPHTRTTIQELMNGPFLNPEKRCLPVVRSDTSLSSLDDFGSTTSTPLADASPDSALGSSGGECCGCSDDNSENNNGVECQECANNKGNTKSNLKWKPKFLLGTKSCRTNHSGKTRQQPPHAISARFLRPLPSNRPVNSETRGQTISVRNAAHLYSIQEEVGRALGLMRLGGDNCYNVERMPQYPLLRKLRIDSQK
ncbi:protein kinase domain-containing protein [Ditylenchus destructor]|nr:protein kinase domain-containing protein [Ditylenchus destructor]